MKRPSIHRLALALLAAGALAGAPAAAQSLSTSAEISGFTWRLIDLDPSDGIIPDVSFFDTSHRIVSFLTISNDDLFEADDGFGTVSLVQGAARASATAEEGKLGVTGQYSSMPGTNRIYASAEYRTGFRLTPNTGILFSALAQVSASHDAPAYGSSAAFLSGWLERGGPGTESIWFSDSVRVADGSQGYALSAFAYTGAVAADGQVELETEVNSYHFAAPVPEPASVAMLVAGLALIGTAARRRRAGAHSR